MLSNGRHSNLRGLDAAEWYAESPFVEALDLLGIGAIPLLPGNEGLLTLWLNSLLEMPDDVLSIPGPQFAGRPWGPPP